MHYKIHVSVKGVSEKDYRIYVSEKLGFCDLQNYYWIHISEKEGFGKYYRIRVSEKLFLWFAKGTTGHTFLRRCILVMFKKYYRIHVPEKV